ncbi:glycoside hydrolase family 5 protein [Candidatus Poribacteria bacterium]
MGGPIIEDNEAMWERLDEFVDKCNAAGVQMMLCWFFNEDSPQGDVGGAVRNSTRYWRSRPETKENAFELWRRIAERYADRPEWAISYDFFNEPAYMNTDHWKEIMEELTAIIRSVDKKHMIVWQSADGWAQPQWSLWMEPVEDDNVIYSFHHYGKHWGYAYDEYYPSYQSTTERTHIDQWLEPILFSIRYNVPIHCGEFGISMIQPDSDGEAWLNDYLALFERFGIGWNWWNYAGDNIYRTGLAAGDKISPYVPILSKWMQRSGWGKYLKKTNAVLEGD